MKYQKKQHSQHIYWNILKRVVFVTLRRKKIIFKYTHARTYTYTLTQLLQILFWLFDFFCFVFVFVSTPLIHVQFSTTTYHQQTNKRWKETTNWRITQGAFCFDLIFDCVLSHIHSFAHSIQSLIGFVFSSSFSFARLFNADQKKEWTFCFYWFL